MLKSKSDVYRRLSKSLNRVGKIPILTLMNSISNLKKQTVFFQTMLSNANFGFDAPVGTPGTTDTTTLWGNASSKIKSGVEMFNHAFSLSADIIWGPVLTSAPSKNPKYATQFSVTDNLVFINSYPDTTLPNRQIIFVSIAGTNMASYDGWFNEDFNVDQVALDLPNTSALNPKVYQGGHEDLMTFVELEDPTSKKKMMEAISAEVNKQTQNGNTVEIIVSGHSLGGGLSPVFSAYIGTDATIKANKNVAVNCFTFAGPTSGNQDFIAFLSQESIGLYPIVNGNDVVPKAWQLSEMSSIYSMFDSADHFKGFEGCDVLRPAENKVIASDYIVKGISEWAISLVNGLETPYATVPQSDMDLFYGTGNKMPYEFVKKTIPLCVGLEFIVTKIYKDQSSGSLYSKLQTIYQFGSGTSNALSKAEISNLLKFLIQLDRQHVAEYIDYIFPNNKELNKYLKSFSKSDSTKDELADEKFNESFNGATVLNKVLKYIESVSVA